MKLQQDRSTIFIPFAVVVESRHDAYVLLKVADTSRRHGNTNGELIAADALHNIIINGLKS